jgi:hypothetical protein
MAVHVLAFGGKDSGALDFDVMVCDYIVYR